jgi:hypothetical protein
MLLKGHHEGGLFVSFGSLLLYKISISSAFEIPLLMISDAYIFRLAALKTESNQ